MNFVCGQLISSVFSAQFDVDMSDLPDALMHHIGSISPLGHEVFNFEVERYHTYIAGGIRVHNTSILSFLNPWQLSQIVPGSLADNDHDGAPDYVELDNGLGGLAASGSTIYKLETVDGHLVAKAYMTHADAYGRLVQTQYLIGEDGKVIAESIREIVLVGAEFGFQIGKLVTPFITAALLDDDASVFESLAVTSIAGTFVQNLFEWAGGAIHSQIVSGGMQNGDLDEIASITFADFYPELVTNTVDNASALLSQWIMAEVFESLNTEEFAGKFAYLLAEQGVNYIIDLSVHEIAVDVLGLSDTQIADFGLSQPELAQIFSGANVLNLIFKAAIGTILPALESVEAQIGSGVISLALDMFAGITGILGTVLGYVGGLILDLIFDKDPSALTSVGYDSYSGHFQVMSTSAQDGGNVALSQGMATAFTDFINGVIDRADSSSNNLGQLASALTLTFGHVEKAIRNGDGSNYGSVQAAISERLVDVLKDLHLNDGDIKFSVALAYVTANAAGAEAQTLINDFSLRLQIASDYEKYLENQSTYDALIAVDPNSAFTVGWAQTFVLAVQFGYTANFTITGDAADSTFRASSGNDSVSAGAGNDVVHGFSGNDTLYGGTGSDTLFGGIGNDRLDGQDGDDLLFGGAGIDTLYGGAGIDQFYVGQSNASVFGGTGEDMITFTGNFADYTVNNLGSNSLTVTRKSDGVVVALQGVEFLRFDDAVRTYDPAYSTYVIGTNGNDLLNGTDLRDALFGLAGDDTIYGFDGNDFISGDIGDDSLFGGMGDDWVFGVLGRDVLRGGAGNDMLFGGADDDFTWGDADNDSIQGEDGDDVLNGGDGSDSVYGGNQDDLVEGGSGVDQLYGGSADDDLFGGAGVDSLYGGSSDDAIYGGSENDYIEGGSGDDVIVADSGASTILGETGDDVITGGTGADQIFGGWGDDTVYGGAGNDLIFALTQALPAAPFTWIDQDLAGDGTAANAYGEWGLDVVYGGDGDDQICVAGLDVVFGGSGNDMFYASGDQGRINGGIGTDVIKFEYTNFMDAVWYKSASGQIGAVIWHNNSNGTHSGAYQYLDVVDIEQIVSAQGEVLNAGYSYLQGGLGSSKYQNPMYTGFVTLSDADFLARFGDTAFLNRSNKGLESSELEDVPLSNGFLVFGAANDDISLAIATYGFSGQQRIRAGAGDDTVDGGSGYDQLYGDAGNDIIDGGTGGDSIDGGDGADRLYGNSGKDTIYGGLGDDKLSGESGDDSLVGGDGVDKLGGGAGHDLSYGGTGDDWLLGESGRDTLYGGLGNDSVEGGASHDTIFGEDGNDSIYGGDGGDSVDGGTLNDLVYGGLGVDELIGGAGDDQLYGDEASDLLYGGLGNDLLHGDDADDNIFGNEGNDTLDGGTGNDLLEGGAGNDLISGSEGADKIDGGDGIDTASYLNAGSGVRVDLVQGLGFTGDAAHDVLISIENLKGSNSDDDLSGNDAANNIIGFSGNDVVNGRAGNDTISGSSGNDSINGGDGNDNLTGDAGNDLILGEAGNDTLNGSDGNDTLQGGDGIDSLLGGIGNDSIAADAGNDRVFGEAGDDHLDGGEGADSILGGDGNDLLAGGEGQDTVNGQADNDNIVGGAGNDALYGEAGADILSGDDGNDALFGGDGDDILAGGAGNDGLTGGLGLDVFVTSATSGHDTINGFEDGIDRISATAGAYSVVIYDEVGGARIHFGPNTSFFLAGISASQISLADFAAGAGTSFQITQGLLGTAVAETLVGTTGSDVIFGQAGNDSISSAGGIDVIYGGLGNDTIVGASGRSDYYGGDGNDTFVAGSGEEHFIGGSGLDTVLFDSNSAGVIIDLATNSATGGTAAGDQLAEIENVQGTESFNDRISGNGLGNAIAGLGGDDYLSGMGGNDDLSGGAGVDSLFGGDGDDSLDGGAGADHLNGGAGIDMLSYGSSTAGVAVNLQNGWVSGGAADGDTFAGFESLRGSDLTGASDTLMGSSGDNTLLGLRGTDLLQGGAGNDTLIGGKGDDTFVFFEQDGSDVIQDFAQTTQNGFDKILLISEVFAPVFTTVAGGAQFTAAGLTVFVAGATVAQLQAVLVQPTRLDGTAGNEMLTGTSSDEIVAGFSGNDSLYGAGGFDALFGGLGADLLVATSDNDSLFGGDGVDILIGGGGADVLNGGTGIDRAQYSTATSAVAVDLAAPSQNTGDAAYDQYVCIEDLFGSSFNDTLSGDSANNRIWGAIGNDYLSGREGNDNLSGDAGNDSVYGGLGNDTLVGGTGSDAFFGGDGADLISFTNAATSGVFVNLQTGEALLGDAAGDTFSSIENLRGSNIASSADTLVGDNLANVIWGDAGNDVLSGGQGNDALYGGVGNDIFQFTQGDGVDRIEDFVAGSDLIQLATETNTFTVVDGTGGATVTYSGGSIFVAGATSTQLTGNIVSLSRIVGTDANETLSGTTESEVLIGLLGNDNLSSNGGDDVLFGGAGIDILIGQSGRSELFGGDGADKLYAGAGAEVLDGGLGADSAYYTASTAAVDINLETGRGSGGNAFGDRLVSIEYVFGSAYSDKLTGNELANRLYGGGANDVLSGNDGVDLLDGGLGNDTLDGGGVSAFYLNTDPNGPTGQIYRLYQGVLDRNPDKAGFETWISQLESGQKTLLQVTTSFVGSVEFQNQYGSTTNEEFVTLLYNNVLERAPDSTGLQTWVSRLDAGTKTREQVVQSFTESGEFRLKSTDDYNAYLGTLRTSDDTLTGGTGADVFVFSGDFGRDIIIDFDLLEAGERIDLRGVSAITTFADLLANHLVQSGSNVIISDGEGNSITLNGLSVSDLTSYDFLF